ncbi:MAG: efflux RND transporter periplasmic adaptor subunit [Acidobacteriota bacterium]
MKKLAWGIVIAGIVVIPVAILTRSAARDDAQPSRDWTSARVTRRPVETNVKATGVIKAMVGAEVKVGSRASGVVAQLHVKIGDRVEKGQLLAELDDRELQARRDQAAAALAAAQANLERDVADLDRTRRLWASGLVAPADLELAERDRAVAAQRKAEAAANLALASTQLDYARIDAPIAGVVASISTQEGETVSASLAAPTFVTLVDLARLEVRAYVDETDIGRIRIGQAAHFTVDTYPGEEFEGRVSAIYPTPEIRDNVVDYITVVDFEAPSGRTLRPEMTTTVQITIDKHGDVLAVPRAALHREGGRTFVYCRRDGGDVVVRPVTTGASNDSLWEVTSGLTDGETVLVGRVDPGARIQQ